jgi:hypothetical protein
MLHDRRCWRQPPPGRRTDRPTLRLRPPPRTRHRPRHRSRHSLRREQAVPPARLRRARLRQRCQRGARAPLVPPRRRLCRRSTNRRRPPRKRSADRCRCEPRPRPPPRGPLRQSLRRLPPARRSLRPPPKRGEQSLCGPGRTTRRRPTAVRRLPYAGVGRICRHRGIRRRAAARDRGCGGLERSRCRTRLGNRRRRLGSLRLGLSSSRAPRGGWGLGSSDSRLGFRGAAPLWRQ